MRRRPITSWLASLFCMGPFWLVGRSPIQSTLKKVHNFWREKNKHVWVYFGCFSEVLGNAKEKANYCKVLDLSLYKMNYFWRNNFSNGCQLSTNAMASDHICKYSYLYLIFIFFGTCICICKNITKSIAGNHLCHQLVSNQPHQPPCRLPWARSTF